MTPRQHINAFLTLLRKEISRCFRIWPQTFAAPVITSTLYFIIFGKILGARVGDQHGFSYIQFIAPGLILMSVLMGSYINTSSSFFGTKFSRAVEELLMSPMPTSTIVLGYTLGGVFRGLFTGLIVSIIAMVFTHIHYVHIWLMFYSIFITSFLFALVGMINGIFARTFDEVSWIPSFILTPLTYLAGVFYSISLLPPVWQVISHFDPVYYLISAFRFSMLGLKSDVTTYALSVSSILVVIAFFATSYSLRYSARMRD